MAVRDDFTAGEVLAAADLNDTFASKPPFAYGTATPSTTVEGFIFYDENVTPPAPKFWDGSAFQSFGGGKILQVVRATDVTQRTTTSTSLVDVTGMSVTITPQKNDSAVIVMATFRSDGTNASADNILSIYDITDASNNAISGAQNHITGTLNLTGTGTRDVRAAMTLIAYDTPATTSATTYKLRFRSGVATTTTTVQNGVNTGQLFAIEVSA
jgi:hypothetical protein